MAGQIITELFYLDNAGSSQGMVLLTGTAVATGGGTSIVINPGNETGTTPTNVSGNSGPSSGLRKFVRWGLSDNVSANPFEVVKSFNTTFGGDQLTITCTANDGFDFWIEGFCAGA